MTPIPKRLLSVTLAITVVFAACDDPAPGDDGDIEVILQSPNDDGAALFRLVGRTGSVVGSAGDFLLTHASGDTLWVFVAREQVGTIRFTVEVAGAADLPATEVIQVADGSNRLRKNLAEYGVTFR